MRRRGVKNLQEKLDNAKENIITDSSLIKGKVKTLYDFDNPLYVEIGCGKGDFLIEHAKRNPNINYLGIEKFSAVIVRAGEKLNNEHLPNLFFVVYDATNLLDLFNKGEIDHLFLNFSDPWPKARHEKRRLTSVNFLKQYEQVLKKEATIEFKTDNIDLFEYSLTSINNYPMEILKVNLNLHRSGEDIITSEYEKKFMDKGPIYYLESRFK